MKRAFPDRISVVGLALALMLGLAGCASHNQKTQTFMDYYGAGHYAEAATLANTTYVNKVAERDRLISLLEYGSLLRAAGDLEGSNRAFDAADELFNKFDAEAEVRLSREAVAAVTNLAAIDYQGYCYDRVMMNVYKALNYVERGDLDKARVELKRVSYAQQLAVNRWRSKIEKLEKAKAEQKTSTKCDVDKLSEDEKFKQAFAENCKDLDALPNLEGQDVYLNPFAEFLQGLFCLCGDSDDFNVGRTAMRNMGGMLAKSPYAQNNPYLRQEIENAERISDMEKMSPTTYVIYEAGLAPIRQEFRVVAVIPLERNRVDFNAAFPKLCRIEPAPPGLVAMTTDGSYPTAVLADMDQIVGQEFKNEMPGVVTRTLVAATAKAAIAYGMREGTRKNNDASALFGDLVGTLYQHATTQADLRTWRTLPKQIQIARFPTPADRRVTLTLPGGSAAMANVQLDPGIVNIIYVKLTGHEDGHCLVRQFKLK